MNSLINTFFNQEIIEKDTLAIIIELFEDDKYINDGDFHEKEIIFDNLYEEPKIFKSAYYDNTLIGYIEDDNSNDKLDGYDYQNNHYRYIRILMKSMKLI